MKIKITTVGNSAGVILPKELLARLRLEKGDVLYAMELPQLHAYGDPAPDLAEGRLAERDFAAWLRERLCLAPRGEAHEPRKPYRAKPRGARRTSARTRAAR